MVVGVYLSVLGNPKRKYRLRSAKTMSKRSAFLFFVTSLLGNAIWAQEYLISTVAGPVKPGPHSFSGDGGPATAAQLNDPADVVVDKEGNILVADTFNDRIRKVAPNGIITTVAGGGSNGSGDGGPATSAHLPRLGGGAKEIGGVFFWGQPDPGR